MTEQEAVYVLFGLPPEVQRMNIVLRQLDLIRQAAIDGRLRSVDVRDDTLADQFVRGHVPLWDVPCRRVTFFYAPESARTNA